MIPQDHITAWSNVVPWASQRQIEQDLIISRALVAIFSDENCRVTQFKGEVAGTTEVVNVEPGDAHVDP